MRKKTYKVNLHLQKKYGCRPEFFDFLNNPRKKSLLYYFNLSHQSPVSLENG